MKTLYININNEQIQSNEELEVLNYDLDSDFFFYLGEKIAKGCKVENETALITDFNTKDNEEDYKQIITQWNEIKTILFSEECEGKIEFTLPNGYIHWLCYSEKYNHVYYKNFSNGELPVIYIDLEELYADSVEDMLNEILFTLKRNDLYLEIDEIVFNAATISHTSMIINSIQKFYTTISVLSLNEWMEKKRLKKEQLENERLERERLKRERLERERLEQERLEEKEILLNPKIQNNKEFYYYYLVVERLEKYHQASNKSEILKAIRLYLNKTTDCIKLSNPYAKKGIYTDPKSPFYGGGSDYINIDIGIKDKYRLNFFLSICKYNIWNEDQMHEIYSRISSMYFPVNSCCEIKIDIPTCSPFNKRYKCYSKERWKIYTYENGNLKAYKIN